MGGGRHGDEHVEAELHCKRLLLQYGERPQCLEYNLYVTRYGLNQTLCGLEGEIWH